MVIDSYSPRRHFSLDHNLIASESNSTMKKRKDFDRDFASLSPASKSRRLDCDFYSSMMDEDANNVLLNLKQSSTGNNEEERALVVYHPSNTHFLKYLSSSDFPIVINTDLIPGLKDYLLSWGIAKLDNYVDDEVRREKSSEVSKDTLAVAPWVAFHSPMACKELVQESGQHIEAEGEMMEMDESTVNNNNEKDMEIGEVEAAGASSPWQQHCMMLNLLQNTSTPIHSCYHS